MLCGGEIAVPKQMKHLTGSSPSIRERPVRLSTVTQEVHVSFHTRESVPFVAFNMAPEKRPYEDMWQFSARGLEWGLIILKFAPFNPSATVVRRVHPSSWDFETFFAGPGMIIEIERQSRGSNTIRVRLPQVRALD